MVVYASTNTFSITEISFLLRETSLHVHGRIKCSEKTNPTNTFQLAWDTNRYWFWRHPLLVWGSEHPVALWHVRDLMGPQAPWCGGPDTMTVIWVGRKTQVSPSGVTGIHWDPWLGSQSLTTFQTMFSVPGLAFSISWAVQQSSKPSLGLQGGTTPSLQNFRNRTSLFIQPSTEASLPDSGITGCTTRPWLTSRYFLGCLLNVWFYMQRWSSTRTEDIQASNICCSQSLIGHRHEEPGHCKKEVGRNMLDLFNNSRLSWLAAGVGFFRHTQKDKYNSHKCVFTKFLTYQRYESMYAPNSLR